MFWNMKVIYCYSVLFCDVVSCGHLLFDNLLITLGHLKRSSSDAILTGKFLEYVLNCDVSFMFWNMKVIYCYSVLFCDVVSCGHLLCDNLLITLGHLKRSSSDAILTGKFLEYVLNCDVSKPFVGSKDA